MNMQYKEDVLKNGFEQMTMLQPDDYEGEVTATLIRKRNSVASAKAILCIHGFNDYFYQQIIAEEFLKKGYHFYALDLRKYGRSILSNHLANNVRNLQEYFEDIDRALAIIRDEGCQKTVLYGHSTGGLIITLYAENRKGKELFDALICNSPFYDFNVSSLEKKAGIPLLSVFGKMVPNINLPVGFSKFYGKSLHKDDFGEWDFNLKWKPHVATAINAGWINAIHEGHLRVANGISLDKPILVLHANKSVYPKKWSDEMFEGDAILNVTDIVEKAKHIESPQKDVIGFDHAIHDLVLSRKPTRDLVFETIFNWLDLYMKD